MDKRSLEREKTLEEDIARRQERIREVKTEADARASIEQQEAAPEDGQQILIVLTTGYEKWQ